MKPIIHKLGKIGRYLEQARDVVESAPGQVGEIRTAVRQTQQQIQQLRAEVLSSVLALKTDGAKPVSDTLSEIEPAAPVLREAGYVVDAVELEMGVVQRWVVHLRRVEDVPASQIDSLVQRHTPGSTTATLLKAIVSSQRMAIGMSRGAMIFTSITVYLGPSPSVRIGWESPPSDPAADEGASMGVAAPTSVPAAAGPSSLASGFGGASSFFESRPPAPMTAPAAPPPVATPAPTTVAPSASPEVTTAARGDWRTDALARFKKMPDVRRRG